MWKLTTPPKMLVDGWTVLTAPHADTIGVPWESHSALLLPSKLFNQALDTLRGHSEPSRLNSKVWAQVWGQVIGGFQDWDERRLLSAQAGEEGGGDVTVSTKESSFLRSAWQQGCPARATSSGLQRTKGAPGAANVDNRTCDR